MNGTTASLILQQSNKFNKKLKELNQFNETIERDIQQLAKKHDASPDDIWDRIDKGY
jgi:hypothetical protein